MLTKVEEDEQPRNLHPFASQVVGKLQGLILALLGQFFSWFWPVNTTKTLPKSVVNDSTAHVSGVPCHASFKFQISP